MITREEILELQNSSLEDEPQFIIDQSNEEREQFIKELCRLALKGLACGGLVEALEKCKRIKVDGHTFESEVAVEALRRFDEETTPTTEGA